VQLLKPKVEKDLLREEAEKYSVEVIRVAEWKERKERAEETHPTENSVRGSSSLKKRNRRRLLEGAL
jgi:hypothetical protein